MKLVLIIVSLSINLDQISKAAWLSRAIMQLAHVVQRSWSCRDHLSIVQVLVVKKKHKIFVIAFFLSFFLIKLTCNVLNLHVLLIWIELKLEPSRSRI